MENYNANDRPEADFGILRLSLDFDRPEIRLQGSDFSTGERISFRVAIRRRMQNTCKWPGWGFAFRPAGVLRIPNEPQTFPAFFVHRRTGARLGERGKITTFLGYLRLKSTSLRRKTTFCL